MYKNNLDHVTPPQACAQSAHNHSDLQEPSFLVEDANQLDMHGVWEHVNRYYLR